MHIDNALCLGWRGFAFQVAKRLDTGIFIDNVVIHAKGKTQQWTQIAVQLGRVLDLLVHGRAFAHEEVETQYQGNEVEIGFNSRYLLDVIGQVDKDELLMKFKDGNSPALVEAENFDSVYVIMPVRI